jgi:uncharacterized damage-inducible protein DinB
MTSRTHVQLVGYKQWADRGLYEVASANIGKLGDADKANLLRVLDHIHVVDRVFMHNLSGTAHGLHAPRSEQPPSLDTLARGTEEVDGWYVDYVAGLPAAGFDEAVDFRYTNGTPARMTRGEMIMHVCLHAAYHRGNAGTLLQMNGVKPNIDRITDYLEGGPTLRPA